MSLCVLALMYLNLKTSGVPSRKLPPNSPSASPENICGFFFAAECCFKALIIIRTLFDSSGLLGVNRILKLKLLNEGPLNNNSKLGFLTAPDVLVIACSTSTLTPNAPIA